MKKYNVNRCSGHFLSRAFIKDKSPPILSGMKHDIRKVLIANRGEIACRIMRTCAELGISTVAVYSDADRDALHVERADEAVHIGPPAPAESYLSIEKIIAAAKRTGADAIHPGYGFLSENERFAKACADAGLIFIGPPAAAIAAMGGKSEAKALMQKAGVPLVPGYHAEDQNADLLAKEADKIGYPVLIKASAGGGGKGMRVVENAAAFAEQLAAAQREGQASFGNPRVLLEKYLGAPRHVEVQVFADTHGNCVHLFERDCSVQRRHQKVIEEAPAPGLSPETRGRMGAAAVAAAKAIGYAGAGTVEFLLDGDDFYFMEMNTRLQVEHPVTEKITGLDLVALQIMVAEGEVLPFTQDDLMINGHAFEVRLYAEDPDNNFLPGAGRISFLRFPLESDGGEQHVRVDTGVREAPFGDGDVISIHYDPMIAKIITWAPTRAAALTAMAQALDETQVAGPKTNLSFLRRLVREDVFVAGGVSTRYIDQQRDALLPPRPQASNDLMALAALGLLERRLRQITASDDPWQQGGNWRIGGAADDIFIFRDGENERRVVLSYPESADRPRVSVDGAAAFTAQLWHHYDDQGFTAQLADGRIDAAIVLTPREQGVSLSVLAHGESADLLYLDPLHAGAGEEGGQGRLTAPMPGKVVAVRVAAGTDVKKGQPLVIVEAMKMEHTITAPADGVIESVRAKVGDQVDEKFELVAFKQAG